MFAPLRRSAIAIFFRGFFRCLVCLTLILLLGIFSLHGEALVRLLHSFGIPDQSAIGPYASMVMGSDGLLYGITRDGGEFESGTFFRISTNGSSFEVLHAFNRGSGDGWSSTTAPIKASDGRIYGVTLRGGDDDGGTIWRWDPNDSTFSVIRSTFADQNDARMPSGLLEATDGFLYGVSDQGGVGGAGTLFRLRKDGTEYSIVRSFLRQSNDGRGPNGKLVEGTDGRIYGVTYDGGSRDSGSVYGVNKDGTGFALLQSFSRTTGDGANPYGGLIASSNGTLFGTTESSVFKISPNGNGFEILHRFQGGSDGAISQRELLLSPDGTTLWGTTVSGGSNSVGTIFRMNLDGTHYRVVHSFDGAHGGTPIAGLTLSGDGTLFGTTFFGGQQNSGTVFRFDPGLEMLSVLWHFRQLGGDGASGNGDIVAASDGWLYGTCSSGGSNGQGAIYRLSPSGNEYSILYHFTGMGGDGSLPVGPLEPSEPGSFHGFTQAGGTNSAGTLFRFQPPSSLDIVHHFGGTDGQQPVGHPVSDGTNKLFGVTRAGGSAGKGALFQLNLNTGDYQILHSFTNNPTDGGEPAGSPVVTKTGWLYGTTRLGGSNGLGTVFGLQLATQTYRVLHHFRGGASDGRSPAGDLLLSDDGQTLYGTTRDGGTNNAGTLFSLRGDGTFFTVLHHFGAGTSDGRNPVGRLSLRPDGWIYGATSAGGLDGSGTFFAARQDGSHYGILRGFSTAERRIGVTPLSGPTLGLDGSLYGVCAAGGSLNAGTVLQLPFWLTVNAVDQLSSNNLTRTTVFSAVPGNSVGVTYQWTRNGTLLDGQTNAMLVLSNATRELNGIYSVTVTSPAGTLVSSNIVLRHRSPQRLQIMSRNFGTIRIHSSDVDGGTISAADLPNFKVNVTTHLNVWQQINLPLVLTNGGFEFDLPNPIFSARFWRVVEQ